MGMRDKESREAYKEVWPYLNDKELAPNYDLEPTDIADLLEMADERDALAAQLELIDKKLATHDGDAVKALIAQVEAAETRAVGLEGELVECARTWEYGYKLLKGELEKKLANAEEDIAQKDIAVGHYRRELGKAEEELKWLRGCGLGNIQEAIDTWFHKVVAYRNVNNYDECKNAEQTLMATIAAILQKEIEGAYVKALLKNPEEMEDWAQQEAKDYAQQRMKEIGGKPKLDLDVREVLALIEGVGK